VRAPYTSLSPPPSPLLHHIPYSNTIPPFLGSGRWKVPSEIDGHSSQAGIVADQVNRRRRAPRAKGRMGELHQVARTHEGRPFVDDRTAMYARPLLIPQRISLTLLSILVILSPVSLTEFPAYWSEHPLLFASISQGVNEQDRMERVLKWFIATLKGQYTVRHMTYE